jgi:hypothetical protein
MLMPRFGMDVVLAHPPEYFLMPQTMQAAVSDAVEEVRFYLRALRRRYSEHDGRGRARFMRDRGR